MPDKKSTNYNSISIVGQPLLQSQVLSPVFEKLGRPAIKQHDSLRELLNCAKHEVNNRKLIVCDLLCENYDFFSFVREMSSLGLSPDIMIISDLDQRLLSIAKKMAENFGYTVIGAFSRPVVAEDVEWALRQRSTKRLSKRSQQAQTLSHSEVLRGLRNNALVVHYQPKWDLANKRVAGFEALSRWQSDDQLLFPLAFIPTAEKYGIIDSLTDSVVSTVIQDIPSLIECYGDQIRVAINYSVGSLQDVTLPDRLQTLCQKYDVSPKNITIEVTESKISGEVISFLEVLSRLHLLGFKLSIDDFGTGYSSLARVKELPFTELKVDRSFVMGVGTKVTSDAVINSSVQLAEELGMTIVAEGVETADQVRLLAEKGCHEIQGFLIDKPKSCDHWINHSSTCSTSGRKFTAVS